MPQWSCGGPNMGVHVRVRVRFDGPQTEVPANAISWSSGGLPSELLGLGVPKSP